MHIGRLTGMQQSMDGAAIDYKADTDACPYGDVRT